MDQRSKEKPEIPSDNPSFDPPSQQPEPLLAHGGLLPTNPIGEMQSSRGTHRPLRPPIPSMTCNSTTISQTQSESTIEKRRSARNWPRMFVADSFKNLPRMFPVEISQMRPNPDHVHSMPSNYSIPESVPPMCPNKKTIEQEPPLEQSQIMGLEQHEAQHEPFSEPEMAQKLPYPDLVQSTPETMPGPNICDMPTLVPPLRRSKRRTTRQEPPPERSQEMGSGQPLIPSASCYRNHISQSQSESTIERRRSARNWPRMFVADSLENMPRMFPVEKSQKRSNPEPAHSISESMPGPSNYIFSESVPPVSPNKRTIVQEPPLEQSQEMGLGQQEAQHDPYSEPPIPPTLCCRKLFVQMPVQQEFVRPMVDPDLPPSTTIVPCSECKGVSWHCPHAA